LTYSIVARCPKTGHFGVAVQSHWFSAGVVCWAKAGIGAVATQAMALIDHGPLGIELMEGGASSEVAMRRRLSSDPNPEIRQVAMIDSQSRVSVHTGSSTIPESGHYVGNGFACQANMMWNSTVWGAMAEAYISAEGNLATRMLSSLQAAEAERGDIRGKQSSRILVVDSEIHESPWNGNIVDIRIDDHHEPLEELDRLLRLHNEYANINILQQGEDLLNNSKIPEIAFWRSIKLVESGRIDEARKIANVAFSEHSGWEELLRRCARNSLAGVTEFTVRALLHPDEDE